MNSSMPSWEREGLEHIWLPYTQMKDAPPPLPVRAARGSRIILEDGRELIDGIASWWSACHGYQHPYIIAAMEKQLRTMPHIMLGGLAHEPAYLLAKRLSDMTRLARVFFSDSGSTAVEVAMKMAVQYWSNRKKPQRCKFICFRHSYHGDTMGAMSLGDTEHGMHKAFVHHTPKQYVLDLPSGEYDFAEFEELLKGIGKTVAGLVIEPLAQGAGGMKFHSADVLAEIRRLCKEHDILFIADEVATGFGRTGSMFACEEAGIMPDILCLGKALSGGTIGLAATLATEEVFSAFLSDNPAHALAHGPTFMGNPLACAAACASLDLFEKEPRLEQVAAIEAQLNEELTSCRTLPNVRDIRIKGAIGTVQLEKVDTQLLYHLRQEFPKRGVWIRPFGDIVYLMPAFTIAAQELSTLTAAIHDVLA